MDYLYLGIIITLFVMYVVTYTLINEKRKKERNEKHGRRTTYTINMIAKVAIFSALSYILYFLKFPLPFFPSFLEINFSMFPILLAGFVLGPWWGLAVVVVRFVLKIPFTHTNYVGELADLMIGAMVVLSSSLFYNYHKNKKGGLISLIFAFVAWIVGGVVTNYYINIPFYVKFYFNGEFEPLVNMLKPLYSNINKDNFYQYYLFLAVIPFNALLALVVNVVTYFVYKRVSTIFKKDFFTKKGHRILIASDSFKGSLSSLEVGRTISNELEKKGYQTGVIALSDGGEGFLDCLEASMHSLKRIYAFSYDAFLNPSYASFLYDENSKHAYFELAEVVGIMKTKERNPFTASTYGLGYIINYALENYDIEHCFIGIGGSASNDGGSGMLEALGLEFYNENNELIEKLNNEKLALIKNIKVTNLVNRIKNVKFTLLTDVTNPLLGPNGATYVYSKQKGAREKDFIELENNLKNFKDVTIQTLDKDLSEKEGSGAAGGCGFGIMSYLNSEVDQGINFLLKEIQFKELVKNYDEVITGEGCFDSQSLQGKVYSGIKENSIRPITIICGISKIKHHRLYSVSPHFMSKEDSIKNPEEGLKKLIDYYY